MLLVELATVKGRLGIPSLDETEDYIMLNFIELAGGRFELETNRKLDRQAGVTDEFDADKTELVPERFPIEAITAWHLKSDETEGWIVQDTPNYILRKQCVVSLGSALGTARERLRITYTGGYVLPPTSPGGGQTKLPDELEHACVEQVAYWYQRRHQLGLSGISGEGGSVQMAAQPLDLLPTVMAVLRKHERYVM